MVNCKKRKNMTGTVDNAVEEIKNFFHTLQTSENWFRFGVTFSTQEKYYFLDTGTGKIFRVNQQVYRVLECILKTNNFENLSYLGMTEEELLLALKEIEKAVKEEHILQAPPVTGMVYYKEDIENSLDHAMQAVTLEITERCNLRCDYCIYNENDSDFRQFGSTDISPDTIKTALDFFFARCGKEFNVGFYGGEPLIRFDLIKIAVEYAEKLVDGTNKELHFSMTSNMTLMNEEIADYIASKPTFSVLCSIDGPQEIHDEHRKTIEGKGSFEKAIAGVRKLVEARKRHKNEQPIIFSAVLTPPYTREKFEKINTFMAKLEWLPENSMVEVSYVSYESKKSHYIPINERPENKLENEKTNWNQTDPLKSWRIFSKEDWSYEGLLTQNYLTKPLNVIHRRKISNEPFKYYTMNGCCIPGARKAFIRTNGDILPCERIGTIAPIGNVFTGFDFKNIEKNYYEDYVREAVRYCGECWAVNICTKCHQDCMDKDGHVDFDYRHANCEFERSEILLHLKIYHELLEHNPEQIQRLNEIDIT